MDDWKELPRVRGCAEKLLPALCMLGLTDTTPSWGLKRRFSQPFLGVEFQPYIGAQPDFWAQVQEPPSNTLAEGKMRWLGVSSFCKCLHQATLTWLLAHKHTSHSLLGDGGVLDYCGFYTGSLQITPEFGGQPRLDSIRHIRSEGKNQCKAMDAEVKPQGLLTGPTHRHCG